MHAAGLTIGSNLIFGVSAKIILAYRRDHLLSSILSKLITSEFMSGIWTRLYCVPGDHLWLDLTSTLHMQINTYSALLGQMDTMYT